MSEGRRSEEVDVECVLRALPDEVADAEHLEDHQLIAYADGALDASAEAVCDRHLAVCAECRALLVAYKTPHDGALDRRAVVMIEGAARSHRRARVAWLSAAAAAVIVAGAGAWVRWGAEAAPQYQLEDNGSGVWRVMSASASAPPRAEFVPHIQVSLNLRPEQRVDGRVELAIYTSREGGALERVGQNGAGELAVQVGDGGGIVIRGTADQLFRSGFGRYVVSFVVARPGACDDLAGRSREDARRACPSALFWGEREGMYREVQPP